MSAVYAHWEDVQGIKKTLRASARYLSPSLAPGSLRMAWYCRGCLLRGDTYIRDLPSLLAVVSSGAEHWKTMKSEQQKDREAANERGEERMHEEGVSVK